ncbi:hypothetical protein HOD83_00785 [Candidatus Woesearchaeota archaeon]|jgi:prefoldin beta subunit|nr:hypothetical protein [Candidatus Woesearchaeota archaeon]MBT4114034.1 hypothetical protein [Candidatus Woesearchaeota archaeon]MBT4248109.1 hypothetical protein [Candidatus Woesearchaeota archaeon]
MASEKINEDMREQIMQMQLLQQRIQVFAAQKQQLQVQQIEIDNALKEVTKTKKAVYSVVGEIMVEHSAADIKKQLQKSRKELDIKIKSIERQENKTKESAEELQNKLTRSLK